MAKVGYVGLGSMGGRMAARLLAAGHQVVGYNRTPDKARWLVDRGLQLVSTPRATCEGTAFVISMVTNSAALQEVTEGPDGLLAGLGPGQVLVDMSTVSPAASRSLAELVRQRGAEMVDAPVSGSITTLEQGKLSIMVGGSPEAFAAAEPLLRDIGRRVTHVGGNGLGVSMKIATNLSLAVQMLAFSEGVLLAERSGIPRATAVDVLTNSVIASPMVQYRGPMVMTPPDEVWFSVTMMQKDLTLALDMGHQVGVPLPTTAVTNQYLTAARGMGLSEEDFAMMFKVLANGSGVTA